MGQARLCVPCDTRPNRRTPDAREARKYRARRRFPLLPRLHGFPCAALKRRRAAAISRKPASGDFSDTATTGHIPTEFVPAIKGQWTFADVKSVLPDSLSEAFIEGMEQFGHRIPGFDDANAVVSGIESRTSSPVRIVRDETLQANIRSACATIWSPAP